MYICTMRSTLVRACGEASLAGRSLLGAIYRRLCGVLSISRGCTTPPRSSVQTAPPGRPYARTHPDQAGRIWPVRAPTREQARQKAPRNDLFSGVYAVLHAQSEGQLQDWDAHREVTLAAQPDVIVRSDAANTTPADPGTGRRTQSHPPRALRLLWCRRQHPRAAEGASVRRALLVARRSGWEDSDNQDEKPGVAAHA